LGNILAQQLKIEQSTEKISESEKKTCPICGITFAQFRSSGRLGCAYDYVCFQEELEPLLINIHGSAVHRGKRPARSATAQGKQRELIQLRREMEEAIDREDYETAGRLRDQIKSMEKSGLSDDESSEKQ
jgi:protein arginine kinase activator